jgi:predicted ATPase
MIKSIYIAQHKCLKDLTITLEPLTVFVGANGSGKTSVLEAIEAQETCRRLLATDHHAGALAETLTKLQQEYPTNFERLRSHFQNLKPSLQADLAKMELQDTSEGTRMVLAIIAAFLDPTRPDLILLDDLDSGLHPLMQVEIVKFLRQMQAESPQLQVIASTHSPYLLDAIEHDEVRLLALSDDGYSVCGKLSEHDDFEYWQSSMNPGEFWSFIGEKWLTEKREAVAAS